MRQPSNLRALRAAWRAATDDVEPRATPCFTLTNAAVPKLYVYDVIGGYDADAAEFVQAVHGIKATSLDLHINSPGGFVYDAVAMYEALDASPAAVNVHVDGLAGSAASFLAMVGDTVDIAKGGRMMIHDAQMIGIGGPADLREMADLADEVSNDIAGYYAVRARNAAYNMAVPPVRPAVAARVTREPLPYNVARVDGRSVFNRGVNGYDFSDDLFRVINTQGADHDATQRVNALIGAAFAPTNVDVDRADTAGLNPNRYAPELWQPQMDYVTPLWDMVNSGTTDGTAFDVPKFSSSAGLVNAATEGTEPAGGSYVVTSQTITPTQVWGKVEVTRQAARRGGRPELSGIIWDQMLREYYEDREAAVATFLNTLTAATDIAITAGAGTNASDIISANDFEAAVAGLQFVRGGNRFTAMATHIDLYKTLARVTDTAGRKLYPMLNPQNANGTAANLFGTLNVAGTRAVPSWALGATGTAVANSWLFDPAKVRGWASAPERLDWNFGATVQTANIPQLSFVTIGIYGDIALANLDIAGVRQVTYDPVA